MAPRYYFRDSGGSTIELTSYIDRKHPPTLKEHAEEGSVAISTVTISDPDMELDLDGLRRFWVVEDDSEATDDVIFGGFMASQKISRGAGDNLEPLGRVWTCEIADANSLWNRRVMTGADCKRPAETDVARVQWLFTTAETGIFDDVTTYVYTGSTHNMDKVDYRRQYRDQVIADASQASGKNWWVQYQKTGASREWVVWYGNDSETGYSSDLYLSNDTSDWLDEWLEDGTSLVWPIQMDAKLHRDPQRVYSGVLVEYEKGAVYRHDSVTTAAFARRDFVATYPNVKTKTKAIARATRLLNKLDEQDERVTATVRLPKGKATMIRAGMRVPVLATHWPGLTTWQWLRVLSCAVTPHESGDYYDLALELAPTGDAADPPITPPYVEWLVLFGESPNYAKMTVEAWGPGSLTTVASSADLVTGTGDPAGAGPVNGVIHLAEEHRRFRYWRITFESVNFDYAVGSGNLIFSLHNEGNTDVCRLGTLWQGIGPWYDRTVVGVTDDLTYEALSVAYAHLYGGGLTDQFAITAKQSDGAWGYANKAISGAWTASATWDWDIGNE
jgi:hypothetical protein